MSAMFGRRALTRLLPIGFLGQRKWKLLSFLWRWMNLLRCVAISASQIGQSWRGVCASAPLKCSHRLRRDSKAVLRELNLPLAQPSNLPDNLRPLPRFPQDLKGFVGVV